MPKNLKYFDVSYIKTRCLIWKPPYQSLPFIQKCSTQDKISFCVIFQYWCKATFFQNYLAFFQKWKYRCWQKTVKIISVNDLLYWRHLDCHTWWKLVQSMFDSLKLDLSLIHVVNFNENQISTLVDFSTRTPLTLLKMDEKWRWNQMWKFCS